jgi:hypothetical protein
LAVLCDNERGLPLFVKKIWFPQVFGSDKTYNPEQVILGVLERGRAGDIGIEYGFDFFGGIFAS